MNLSLSSKVNNAVVKAGRDTERQFHRNNTHPVPELDSEEVDTTVTVQCVICFVEFEFL